MTLRIYSTCPQSKDVGPERYLDAVVETARWSEEAGCTGMLVYTDNGIADPWLVAQAAIRGTERLAPLVAVQPVYAHPYTVAKTITSLSYLYGRSVHLNMLAGGFRNDLLALGDDTPHDDRYLRTAEYTRIVTGLLRGETVTLDGRYHQVTGLKLAPPLPPELMPEVLISGSSPAGRAAAAEIGAVPVRYPQPLDVVEEVEPPSGVRIGIIARDDTDEAWRVAHERFPADRHGQVAHKMAMKVSDSHWHHQLSATAAGAGDVDGTGSASLDAEPDPYWLGPFQNYQTFCPYLVGSVDRVAAAVAHYIDQGTDLFVMDIPPSAEELEHAGRVFARAQEMARA